MKYKVGLIAFNFGKLPNYFDFWLRSAEYNSQIDFLLYIDDKTHYNFPENVRVTYTTFEECLERAQRDFDFELNVHEPYKFCDLRPTFGEVFREDLENYDFWGTVDLDIVMGDLSDFLRRIDWITSTESTQEII